MTALELLDRLLDRFGRVTITRSADIENGCNRDRIVVGVESGQRFEIDCPTRFFTLPVHAVERRECLEIGLGQLDRRPT